MRQISPITLIVVGGAFAVGATMLATLNVAAGLEGFKVALVSVGTLAFLIGLFGAVFSAGRNVINRERTVESAIALVLVAAVVLLLSPLFRDIT